MTEYMYRFRSRRHVLEEHAELANQTIYFARRDELNDPMEGFKDIYWLGDKIAWQNLFNHYLLCLEDVCALTLIDTNVSVNENSIRTFKTIDDEPTEEGKLLHKEIRQVFFSNINVCELLEQLSSLQRHVHRNELLAYIRTINPCAINAVLATYSSRNLIKRPEGDPFLANSTIPKGFTGMMDTAGKLSQNKDEFEALYAVLNNTQDQIGLIEKYNVKNQTTAQNNWRFLITDFSKFYVRNLEQLLCPDWYVAAFSSCYDDPSLWAYYAENHKGFCLKFRRNIKLYGVHALGGGKGDGRIYDYRDYPFQKINYADKYPEIDFFRSLGRLPVPYLFRNWYADESKNISICASHLNDDEAQTMWRREYWKNYEAGKNTKLMAWRHEKEYRLTCSDSFITDPNDKKQRTLKYSFESLDGIIFGINTPEADKLEIMKIIEQKCRLENRPDFNFYQAFYSPKDGNMQISPLNLIKIKF